MSGLTPLEWELLEACKAQHQAIDLLLAALLHADPTFRPSQSAAWPAVEQGWAVISKASAKPNFRPLSGSET